ncbi:hypothetical protein DYB32_001237 [Aphanomyces invadans]|uniref:Uncharacterized protein n=1 Tax=Aphanomyces invadans TaxID=157072 RepID=A0A418B7B4_9STRA|nr:hypothetical protein DYB32_001237 [Aphanomyces invadans]
MMKPTALLLALAALVSSSEVIVKFSDSNLVKGSQDTLIEASTMSLARLAVESLALPQAVVSHTDEFSVVADLFAHTNAFGFVVLENAAKDLNVESGNYAFEKSVTLQDATLSQLPQLINAMAEGLKQKNAENVVSCFGEFCSSTSESLLTPVAASKEDGIWSTLDMLEHKNAADKKFVQELAHLHGIVENLQAHPRDAQTKGIFVASVAGLSELDTGKQASAQAAVEKSVAAFQSALKTAYGPVGFQVFKLSGSVQVDPKDLTAFVRQLSQLDVSLAANTTNGTLPNPLTVESIAEYQVILWTSVLLVVVAIVAVSMMGSIDASRDNLLYAKFLTDPNGRKND